MGLPGNESAYSNRLILVYPKLENGVRIQAKLGSKNPTGLPVGVVSTREQFWVMAKFKYPTHQINFCTKEALQCLKYRGYEVVE